MSEEKKWEYRVESLGSALRSPKDEEIEALLNEWGKDGWEVISVHPQHNSTYKVRVVAKRPLTVRTRRQRSMPSFQ